MVTEQKKRRFLPYFIIGLILFYVVHWLVKLYAIAPASKGVILFDNARLDWMMANWSSKSLIDVDFTQTRGEGLTMLPGLVSNSWAQVILPPQSLLF